MNGVAPIMAMISSLCIAVSGCAYRSQSVVHMDTFDLTTLPESESWNGPGPCGRKIKINLSQVRIGVSISSASAPVEEFIHRELVAAAASCQGMIVEDKAGASDYDVKATLVEWDRDLGATKRSSGSYVVTERTDRVGGMTMEFIVTRRGHKGSPARIVKQAVLSDSDSSVYSLFPSGQRSVVRASEGEAIRQMCREAVSDIHGLVCQ